MPKNTHLFRHSTAAIMITLLIGLLHPASVAAGVIGVRSSSGIKNSDGNYLAGDGFLGSEADCLVQCIYAGADGIIDPPHTADGSTTGDDQLLELEEFSGRFYTVIGEGYPFSPNAGKFAEDFRHFLNAGSKIYCRAWNSYDFASATCYGDSPLYTIENTVGESHDFGTWITDMCAPSSSTTTVASTTTTVEVTTTLDPTTSTIESTTTAAEITTTVDQTTTTVDITTSSVESTTTSIIPTTTTTEENSTTVLPTTTTTSEEITTTIEPATSSVEPSTTSIAFTTTVMPVTTTIRPPTTSIVPIITTSIPKPTTSIGPVITTTSSQKTSTTSTINSSTTTTADAFTVNFTADVRTVRVFQPVQFTSACTGMVREYRWRFGDGTESTEAHPRHIYKKKGAYDVMLTVRRDDGSTATETKEKYLTVRGFCPLSASLSNDAEIDVFYKVRDRLLPSPTGIMLITWYYRHAFELVQLLEEYPHLQKQLREIVTNNLGVIEEWVVSGQAVVPTAQVDEVMQLLISIKAQSSQRLCNDIDMLIAGLNDGYVLQEFHIQVE